MTQIYTESCHNKTLLSDKKVWQHLKRYQIMELRKIGLWVDIHKTFKSNF